MKPISKVETWNEIGSPLLPESYRSALSWILSPAEVVFENIWMPVKYVTEDGIDEDWSYINIGLDADAMADVYNTQYGANYLSEYISNNMDSTTRLEQTSKLRLKVASIVDKNEGKYLKLVELQGYTYNPLWNVDGVETTVTEYGQHVTDTDFGQKQLTDNIAQQQNTSNFAQRQDTDNFAQQQNTDQYAQDKLTDSYGAHTDTTNHYETTMDAVSTANLKTRDESINAAKSDTHTKDAKTDTHTLGAHNDTHTIGAHNDTFTLGGHIDTHTHSQSRDTVTSNEHSDTVTYERHGNIGVTKTQELIESERANLRFNLIQELFNDINEYILVGIYD